MFFWKILLIGPPGTAYNKGVFLLTCKFPNDYPDTKPTIVFKTEVYHCNVSGGGFGKVCGDFISELWNKAENRKVAKVL